MLAFCLGLALYAFGPVSDAHAALPDSASPALSGPAGATADTPAAPTPASPPSPGAPAESIPSDEELAAEGAVIGEIVIRNENIFDLSDPKENNWLFRLANGIHVKTQPWVIRGQLLFRTGDPYDRRLLEESERNLRANRYFYDASIRPIRFRDGRVDVEVLTRDVWTLRLGFRFGREGGANTLQFNVGELNLFGTGIGLVISEASTPDRNIYSLAVSADPIPTTRVNARFLYAEYSDGWARAALVERPFYALDTRWAAGAGYTDNVTDNDLVGAVDVADRYQVHAKRVKAWAGWSGGLRDRRVIRYTLGFTRDESLFAAVPGEVPSGPLPPDRILAYPWVGFELLEDAYEKAWNRDQIQRTEDFYLGTHVKAALGYSDAVFGANHEGIVFSGGFGTSSRPADSTTLFLSGDAAGRYEDGSVRDTILGADGRLYIRRRSENWLVFSLLSAKRGIRLDPDHELLLGGDNGLRGYPRQYQAGDRSALFTLEGRYYSDLYLFRLLRIGAAVFYDMGRAWGGDFVNEDPGILRDVGAGLRFGLVRSAHGGMLHVDLAFPLDGDPSIARVQLLVGSAIGF
jgi:hypothetical protein